MKITHHAFDALDPATLYRALKLRQDVFILEQRCIYPELDDLDQGADHLLGWRDGALIAYLRVLPPGLAGPEVAIGRVVIHPDARGEGLGYALMRAGLAHAHARWGGPVRIAAQAQLRGFYEALGFTVVGPAFDDEGIMHLPMLIPGPLEAEEGAS